MPGLIIVNILFAIIFFPYNLLAGNIDFAGFAEALEILIEAPKNISLA